MKNDILFKDWHFISFHKIHQIHFHILLCEMHILIHWHIYIFEASQPCDNTPCFNGATCENRGDGFLCICPRGFAGTKCQIRVPCKFDAIYLWHLSLVISLISLFWSLPLESIRFILLILFKPNTPTIFTPTPCINALTLNGATYEKRANNVYVSRYVSGFEGNSCCRKVIWNVIVTEA